MRSQADAREAVSEQSGTQKGVTEIRTRTHQSNGFKLRTESVSRSVQPAGPVHVIRRQYWFARWIKPLMQQ